jgi:hypothetical protein
VVSIVIPAHNEEQVIGRCLSALLRDAEPDEFDVVVVTNGCTDRTAEVAGSFPGVRVVDSPVASKPAALTLGDEVATSFPRMYVDADVEVGADAVRAVAAALSSGSCNIAAPRLQPCLEGRPWAVRAYYEVWTRLPYVRDDHVGSGFYALSEAARQHFGAFPDTMAEDFFIHSLVPASERCCVEAHHFTTHPPFSIRSLVKIQARIQAANARNHELFADQADTLNREHKAELARLARRPSMAPKVAVYALVTIAAKLKAKQRNRSAAVGVWDRDDTARAQAATPAGRAG